MNSDGVNCVGSSRVTVRRTFVRSYDDSFVVKTTNPQRSSTDILYEDCIAWNDWGYALGVSYETRADIRDVVFRNCHVLFARNWPLGVHVSDAGKVGPIRFENISVHYPRTSIADSMSRNSIRLDIVQDEWGNDEERGHIHDIVFRDVQFNGSCVPPILLSGFDANHLDANHLIENISFHNVRVNGQVIKSQDDSLFQINQHVKHLDFAP